MRELKHQRVFMHLDTHRHQNYLGQLRSLGKG